MKKLLFSILFLFTFLMLPASTKDYAIGSPDKNITMTVSVSDNGTVAYALNAFGRKLITPSPVGLTLENGTTLPSHGAKVLQAKRQKQRKLWKPLWGKRSEVKDHYNELVLTFAPANEETTEFEIAFRAYNDGVAFRYALPGTGQTETKIKQENTTYHFTGNYTAWFYNGERHNIGPLSLTDCNGTYLPVMTIQAAENAFLAIHEACLDEGDPLKLASAKGETAFTTVTKPLSVKPGYHSAWRTIFCARSPGDMVDSHLLELLNPEPETDYDFSWVKPGMAVWDWRIDGAIWNGFHYKMSYPSWVRMVDFAAEQGFAYLVLDANWYGPEFAGNSDPVKGGKANDVQRLIAYARNKGVGIWLYLNDVGGKQYSIEETLKQYGRWGAAGVKYGFMKGTMEEKNLWTQKVTRLCAENRLLVDYHDGPVHPYGQARTWPNAVTREYCQAQLDAHRVFEPNTFVTSVFVNMLAGPIDMNNGFFELHQGKTTRTDNPQEVPATLAAEAARTLITYSGVTILPDIPEYYRLYPSLLRYLSAQKMPWRESKTLSGEIGKSIVEMRQAADGTYLLGAATNEEARELTVPLTFLEKGYYEAEITEDGTNAHYQTNREAIVTRKQEVTRKDILTLHLAPGGGACVRIYKVK